MRSLPGALAPIESGDDRGIEPTAVALSPLPATGQVGGAPASRVIDSRPLRAQYEVISKPGRSASGPLSPKP